MGLTSFPAETVLSLARAYDATAFVETGTFHGATALWAAEHFDIVHTIELGEHRYLVTSAALASVKNIVCHQGDSRQLLPETLSSLAGRRAVFYLDGHWSGEGTDGEADQCPLLGELALLSAQDVIVIDDARLFIEGVAKLPPLDPAQWPSYEDVLRAIPEGMFTNVLGDVIFAVPNELRELVS